MGPCDRQGKTGQQGKMGKEEEGQCQALKTKK